MAATPYNISLAVANKSGQKTIKSLSASDVAAAFWLTPAGTSDFQLSTQDCVIYDISTSSAAVDCKTVTMYVNGFANGIIIYPNINQGTQYQRQVMAAGGIAVPAGATVRFVQSA